MTKTYHMQNIELRLGKPIEDVIREQIEAGKTQEEIARYLDISYWTFRNWLYRLGAEFATTVRFRSEEPAVTP